jgi:choline monooxygenase
MSGKATQLKEVPGLERFHADPARSYTLPAHYAYDPEIFAREKKAIFYRTWQLAGHGSQLEAPGDYVTCRVADQDLLVIRGKDGELRAFYNVCAHRAHKLLEGSGRAKVIVCPYHAWSYHADGRLRSARNSEKVAGFDLDAFCLTPVKVESFLGFVFVNLDPAAPSLKSQAGDLEEEVLAIAPDVAKLKLAHRKHYDIKANWKNLIENYSECYHCPASHPDFANRLIEMDSYRITTHAIYHSHRSCSKPPGNTAYDIDTGVANAQEFASWYLWPNLAIEVYPGGFLNVFQVAPEEPERSLQTIDWYFFDETPTAEQAEVVKFLDETVRAEDVTICESVQRGLHSRGYRQGRFIVDPERSDRSEHAVHHFQSLVRDALGE